MKKILQDIFFFIAFNGIIIWAWSFAFCWLLPLDIRQSFMTIAMPVICSVSITVSTVIYKMGQCRAEQKEGK